jgi:four helix bundle protein
MRSGGMHRNEQLSKRLLQLAVRVLTLVQSLPRTVVGRHIGRQLIRAGTSPGANYEEAGGAESRRDFAHKLGIVLKELKETRYWLRLCREMALVKPASRLDPLLDEVEQLVAIFAKSVRTLKARESRQDEIRDPPAEIRDPLPTSGR